jgi:hypothetical protein
MVIDLDVVLLILRLAAGVLLTTFVGAVFYMLWRDLRTTGREVASRTRQRGRLVVVNAQGSNGHKPGTAFPMLPLTSIGRGTSNTIIIEDAFASSEHALLTLRGGQWWLEDLGSSNGTRLNGFAVQQPIVVSTGDMIAVGQLELKLELE